MLGQIQRVVDQVDVWETRWEAEAALLLGLSKVGLAINEAMPRSGEASSRRASEREVGAELRDDRTPARRSFKKGLSAKVRVEGDGR